MAENQYVKQRLKAMQSILMAIHEANMGLPTSQIGTEREAFVREFLGKIFPAHRRFTMGTITDSFGEISGQVDIAIEWGFSPSFPLPSGESRLLLAESVACTLEVKSNISTQWGEAQETCRKIKKLKRKGLNPFFQRGEVAECIPVVFVGYKGYTTIEGLKTRFEKTPVSERPDAVLGIESGLFYWPTEPLECGGVYGLFGLCHVIHQWLSVIDAAAPNIANYAQ